MSGNKLDTNRPLPTEFIDSPEQAKAFAEILIKNGFNAAIAAKEWRPHLSDESARRVGNRCAKHPAVVDALAAISLDSSVNENADGYKKTLWAFVRKLRAEAAAGTATRSTIELGSLALKLLQKAYIVEQTEEKSQQTIRFEGLGDVASLTQPARDDDDTPTKETVQ
jgi:hypothetical protein